jgi:2-desacetyl-2-hydroxyethyl bacteriochlorophyllide A dehydrogenase
MMKAALLIAPRKLVVTEVPIPEPGPGDVLIRILLGGLCGSDHTLYNGGFGVPLPVIPGHEAIGRIEKTGQNVTGLTVGQRVTIQPNIGCGTCRWCRAGHKNLCPSKVRIGVDKNGLFAEYAAVPADYAWPVPDGLADDVAVFTEPLAVTVHAMKIWKPRPQDRTLIFGAGVMGLLAMQLALHHGGEVAACDLAEGRLAKAGQLGASRLIGPDDSLESVYGTFDVIYETSGAPVALEQVIRLAAPKGKIVILGLPSKDLPVPVAMIVRKELQVMGSLIYTDEFHESMALLESGRVRTAPINTGVLRLEDIDEGLRKFTSPDRVKMLVKM